MTPVRDAEPGEDRFFEDHGLYAEEAFMRFVEDDLALLAGKFTPHFGIAWSDAPGIWGRDVAERNYKFIERVGFGGAYEFDLRERGTHTISASMFFLDISPLYQSPGRGRDHQFQATIGYRPVTGLLIEAGWLTEEVNDVPTHPAGAMVTYKRSF